ncbi:MAG: hypothetical protein JWO87_524 [Phycisphaerales bacterium]|nr:hypothetical protein [Phycisphaerales bacterium]
MYSLHMHEFVFFTANLPHQWLIADEIGVANGSEQPFDASHRGEEQRWADDGGPSNEPPGVVVPEPARKPAWSVLSSKDLNEALRRARADAPASRARETERAELARARALAIHTEEVATAIRDRYPNAWETT